MPVVVLERNTWLLVAILSASFCAFLILPSIGTFILNEAKLSVTERIAAFFNITFGVWAFAIFVWASCFFSHSKGRSFALGLLSLSGGLGLIALWITASPVAGVASFLGLLGVAVPYGLGDDAMERLTARSTLSVSSGAVLFAAFGLFAGIACAYGNSFYGGMTLDNKYIIEEYYKTLLRQDPTLDVMSFKMLGYIFSNDYWWPKGISGLYRPLVTLSYWLNYVCGDNKLDPFQYHVVNFFLHWFAAFLGFLLIRLLTGRNLIAFLAALLFATHPVATESVSNIIGRADIMAACATFAGSVLYIHSTKTVSQLRWVYLIGLMLVTLLGIFAKESAIAIAAIIVVYDLIYRWTRRDFIEAIPTLMGFCILTAIIAGIALFVGRFGFLGLSEGVLPALKILLFASVTAAIVILSIWYLKIRPRPFVSENWLDPWMKYFIPYLAIVPPLIIWIAARAKVFYDASPPETPFLDNPIRGLGFLAARMTASDVFLRLFGLLVWPAKLSCDYSFNQIPLFNGDRASPDTWLAFAGVATLVALLILVGVFYKRQKIVSFLILFFLIVYLPTSNFLIIIGSIMAERFLYLPLLAFTAAVVITIDACFRHFSVKFSNLLVTLTVIILMIGCTVRTCVRNNDWLSDIALWSSAIKVSPMSFRSYQSGAFAFFEQFTTREATGEYRNDRQDLGRDIDHIISIAEQAKPIVDVLPLRQNSSRLYLHLGMYYSKKGDTLARPTDDGLISPDDPAVPWYRASEHVLQQGSAIDREFNKVNYEKEVARKIKSASQIADVGLPPIYFYLSYAYSQLRDWSKALQTMQYQAHLDPSDADVYFKIGIVEIRQNRFEAAAASLLQALILRQDMNNVWPALALAFGKILPDGPKALVETSDKHVHLELGNAAARSAMCSAYQNFVRDFRLAKRDSNAEQFSDFAKKAGFPPALFDDLLKSSDDSAPVPPPPD